MDYNSNTQQRNINYLNAKSIPIPIIDSPKANGTTNNTTNYQYNETSFDPCSGSPPNNNNFILKLEHRYEKLHNNK